MKPENTVTTDEMLAALSRSGYLLESEIAKTLTKLGFFVETSKVIEDPFTGKSRELDIIAEYYDPNRLERNQKCNAKIEFVFEVKNNIFPLVVMTELDFNPRIDDFTSLKEAITTPKNLKNYYVSTYSDRLISDRHGSIFTQYCSFQKKNKNDELMALHPENVHSGLSKIVQYCEEESELMDTFYHEREEDDYEEHYFRHFLYMPILLINDDLFEYRNGILEKVDSTILVTHYHYKKEPRMAYIFIVTKNGLEEFLSKALKIENEVEQKMAAFKNKIMS